MTRLRLKQVDRLIARHVLAALAVTLMLFVAIDAISALGREIDEFGEGDYTLGTALAYIALSLPRRAYEFFPFAAVIGTLVGLGGLAASAELTAMRAGGMSQLRIAGSALLAVAVAAALMVAIGETVAPDAERRGAALVAGAKSKELIRAGRSGIWAREGDTLVNARRGVVVGESVALEELRLYEFDAVGRLVRITLAARAEHEPGRWRLAGVVRQRFAEDAVETTREAALDWPSQLEPGLLATSILRPQNLGLGELSAAIRYMRANGIDATAYESAYWKRLFYPFGVLALVLAVVPFAFGALRSGGLGKRILLGMVLAIAWYFAQQALFNLAAVYGVDPRLGQGLPPLLLALVAAIWFARAR
jgi:lipopolysaccharide export system permease protein